MSSTREQTNQRISDATIPDDPRIPLDEFQTAKLLNCSVHKLRRDRWKGGGIPYMRIDGLIRYDRADLSANTAKRYKSTSEYPTHQRKQVQA